MNLRLLATASGCALFGIIAAAGAQAPPPAAPGAPPPPPPVMGPINWTGAYVGLSGGFQSGKYSNSSATINSTATTAASTLPLKRGFGDAGTGGGQIGYNWQWNNFVFGGEGDFRGSTLDRGTPIPPTATGLPPFFIPGDNFHVRTDWTASARGRVGYAWDRFLLYATGGVAFADTRMSASFVPVTAGGFPFPGSSGSDTKTLIGPTVGGGFEYRFSPHLSLAAEYRYSDYGSENFSLGRVAVSASGTPTAPTFNNAAVTGRTELQTHEVLLKLNYAFNAPPPATPEPLPPPPPPPAAQQVFLVFFDWDKDVITPAGMEVIRDAAAAWRAGAPVQIQVTGYTDRSGSPGYNQRLSDRRASKVAEALGGLGVPRNVMDVHGRGENDNRVPTADGVREPQNRRVEIFYLR